MNLLEIKEKQNSAHSAQHESHSLDKRPNKGWRRLTKLCEELFGLRAGYVHLGRNMKACAKHCEGCEAAERICFGVFWLCTPLLIYCYNLGFSPVYNNHSIKVAGRVP